MTTYHQQSGTESERRYSPEEAGEILKLAANLQDDSFTLEQLRAIAREAGIEDQQLSRALEQYEQRQQHAVLRRQEKQGRRRRWLIGAGILLVLAALFVYSAVSWVTPAQHSEEFHPTGSEVSMYPATPADVLEMDTRVLLASSRSCKVYKERHDNARERVVIARPDGSEFVVGHYFSEVASASVSPTGKHIALLDAKQGEVWVVDVNGEGLHSVARKGEKRSDGFVVSKRNPIAGWATFGGKDRLKIWLVNGGYTYVFVEP